ncbi:Protein STU1 [Trichinella pseudospiralis]
MKERPDFSTTVTHLGQEFVLLIFWIEVKANFKASSFDKANNLLGLYRPQQEKGKENRQQKKEELLADSQSIIRENHY